jgi:phosphonate transport system substrate-binding protein
LIDQEIESKAMAHALVRILLAIVCLGFQWTAGANPAAPEKPLQLGVLPNVSARVLLQQYEPMLRYLQKTQGRPVDFSSAPNWPAFYRRAGQEEFDVVVAASNVARLLEKDFAYRPILAFQPKVPALFVTLATTSGSASEILRGKHLALANPASLVALEGLAWLRSQGLEAGQDHQIITVRSEDSVGNALVRGEAAAGILSMGELRQHPPNVRDKLKVHSAFKEVPGFVVLVSPKMSASAQSHIRQQLLAFAQDNTDGAAFFALSGFKDIVPVNEAEMLQLDAFVDATRKAVKP